MPHGSYHDALWEAVPDGLEPPCFKLRRSFLLAHVSAGQRALDVGCGEGAFAGALAASGLRVTAADVAATALERAREHWPTLELVQLAGDSSWPLEDSSFDVVWAGEVIEHVADTAGWLSELRRVLRPRGMLLLSTPNHGRLALLAMAARPRAFDAQFDPLADHLRFYTARSLRGALAGFGFTDVGIQAVCGPPWCRRVLLASARRGRWA